jgi:transcriptional regulator
MYLPPHFETGELSAIHDAMESCGLANVVTWTGEELIATPLPLILARDEGDYGTLYGHLAKANDQWHRPVVHEALVLFSNVDAYVTPSWYATKVGTGKVVPTWNYDTVHAYGAPEFFHDEARLLDVVTRLTQRHENERSRPWKVSDAPIDFIRGQLRGIVGFCIRITRLEGKRKMSQNRSALDREGVATGLRREGKEEVARLIPQDK